MYILKGKMALLPAGKVFFFSIGSIQKKPIFYLAIYGKIIEKIEKIFSKSWEG
jgi:hypothetical protein